MTESVTRDGKWCPGARPEQLDAVIFGVRTGAADGARIGYLDALVPMSDALLELAQPVDPLEVFRVGAPCAEGGCAHFRDRQCGLASRIVEQVPVVVSIAPACALRSKCRWWAQEGTPACMRCPVVVTSESGRQREVAQAAQVPSLPGSSAT